MHLTKPTLLIDPQKCRENLKFMKNKAEENKLIFRPHFKTHQSNEVGKMFREEGINEITVSSVEMANYFAEDGWEDILIAFPLNINQIEEINKLASKIRLHVTLENEAGIKKLQENLTNQVGVYIKIDAGYGRTGINWSNTEMIEKLTKSINSSDQLTLEGLLVHSGHTYQANTPGEIIEIQEETIQRLNHIKNNLPQENKEILLSIGDTPGSSIANDFKGIDEIRPGNFIFYDLQQYKLGACSIDNIAVCLASPIVAKHKERGELIIYGGAVHFSKEFMIEGDEKVYGYGIKMSDEGWMPSSSRMILSKLSQEHGTVSVTPDVFSEFQVGDFIGILPVHSCLTANLMGGYRDFYGNSYDHMNG